MYQRGIRGAITVENNTLSDIEKATVELYSKITELNDFNAQDISHIIFTMTQDLNCAYPAKFLRQNFDIKDVPLMCIQELNIENSLKMCLRILVVINTDKTQSEIKHVYLGGAELLRPDLK